MSWYGDALASTSWLEIGADNQITYSFANDYGRSWTEAEKAAFRTALQTISNVANITFEEVASGGELIEHLVSDQQLTTILGTDLYNGWHNPPSPTGAHGFFVRDASYFNDASLQKGGNGFWVFIHEVGHGLGLEHPHSTWHGSGLFQGVTKDKWTDRGNFGLNHGYYTMMSYNQPNDGSGYGWTYGGVGGPMALDIAALQELYGANTTYNSGNSTYWLPGSNGDGTYWTSIWDTGGTDEIAYSGALDVVIDLRPATLVQGYGGGGYFSAAAGIYGGYSIANGVDIENARGGSGNDVLIGNHLVNVLNGGAGNDLYITDDAADIIIDSSGIDMLQSGVDTSLMSRPMIENLRLTGSAVYGFGNDLDNGLIGSAGRNVLDGGNGDDWIYGGRGRDTLTGGDGADTFAYSHKYDSLPGVARRDTITDFEIGVDTIDLSAIDAKRSKPGNDMFKWIGMQKFHGREGELHYVKKAGFILVEGDIDGDGRADFQIKLDGLTSITKYDFDL
ncbi:MAG: M10 family metallopeptidase C-terminal domain-containing protein [Pseudomonadota bacterium]